MADLYIDSDKEVLRINGKCYYKVVGDSGYQTHTTAIIQDTFDIGCNECYTTTTLNAGDVHLFYGSLDNIRFTGNPGETALVVIDDGNGVYNIQVGNVGGTFVWDLYNTNNVLHTFGTPPETYTFSLGGVAHSVTFTGFGSLLFNFAFNTTNQTIVDLFPGDANRNGTLDGSDPDPYSEIGAKKAGFSAEDISPDFGSNLGNYIEIDIGNLCFRSNTPHAGAREDAILDIINKINAGTDTTGIRANFDGQDVEIWFATNNQIKPQITVIVSVAAVETGFETLLPPESIKNLVDSDGDGILDDDDPDPFGLTTGTSQDFDDDNIPAGFPSSVNDVIRICVGPHPARCYSSFLPPTTKEQAILDIQKSIAQDFEIGLIDYTAVIDVDGNIQIIKPSTGLPPTPISAEVVINGVVTVLQPGIVPTPTPWPTEVNISGFSTVAANGTYALDGGTEGGKNTYSNGNGWFMFWDGAQWVISDVAYNKTGNWIGNGSADIDTDFDGTGNTTGFAGQTGTSAVQSYTVANLGGAYGGANGTYQVTP